MPRTPESFILNFPGGPFSLKREGRFPVLRQKQSEWWTAVDPGRFGLMLLEKLADVLSERDEAIGEIRSYCAEGRKQREIIDDLGCDSFEDLATRFKNLKKEAGRRCQENAKRDVRLRDLGIPIGEDGFDALLNVFREAKAMQGELAQAHRAIRDCARDLSSRPTAPRGHSFDENVSLNSRCKVCGITMRHIPRLPLCIGPRAGTTLAEQGDALTREVLSPAAEGSRSPQEFRAAALPTTELEMAPEDLRQAGYPSSKIKPCPLCGKAPLTTTERNPDTGYLVLKIFCPGTLSRTCVQLFACCTEDEAGKARAELIERWNQRVPVAPAEAFIVTWASGFACEAWATMELAQKRFHALAKTHGRGPLLIHNRDVKRAPDGAS